MLRYLTGLYRRFRFAFGYPGLEVESVKRFVVTSADVVILRSSAHWSDETQQTMKEAIGDTFAPAQLMLIGPGIEIEAVMTRLYPAAVLSKTFVRSIFLPQ